MHVFDQICKTVSHRLRKSRLSCTLSVLSFCAHIRCVMHLVFLCSMCVCVLSRSVVTYSLRPHGLQPARLLCPWNFNKNTGVGCQFLLQGIFLIQGSNPSLRYLLHWQADSLPLSHLRSPSAKHTLNFSLKPSITLTLCAAS